MCGIIGYTGSDSAQYRIIEGLRRLEYRGYDSAGIALVEEAKKPLLITKRAGKLANLEEASMKESRASTGIGHTRWATHGGPTDANAHPHTDETGKVAVIHNGIIENYRELKTELEGRGHKFKSETDTESVAFLLADELNKTRPSESAYSIPETSIWPINLHSDEP